MTINGNEERPLPEGWVWTKLRELVTNPKEDIVDGPFGSNLKASEYVDSGIPIIRLQNIDRDRFNNKNIRFVTPEKAEELSRHSFISGDIVITKLGDPLGEACVVPDYFENGIIVADVVRARIDETNVVKKYLVHCINSEVVIRQLAEKTKGTTRPRVNLRHIRNIDIPLAPLPEQERIVAEIEKQFTRLDKAVTGLERLQANLDRYRASVLKATCEGRLVPQDPDDEPADQLLQRILTQRRRQWEEQEWQKQIERAQKKVAQKRRKAAGLPYYIRDLEPEDWQDIPEEEYADYLPKSDKWKQKYEEPEGVDTAELPELPEGWVWVTLPHLGELARGKSTHRPRNDPRLFGGGYPFIQTGEVRKANGNITTYTETYNEFGLEQSRIWPKGTLCITIAANIAETAILNFSACFPDSIVGFVTNEEYCDVRFIEYFMRTV